MEKSINKIGVEFKWKYSIISKSYSENFQFYTLDKSADHKSTVCTVLIYQLVYSYI